MRFWYYLKAHLPAGDAVTVRELQSRMGSDEFTTWIAYNEIAPLDSTQRLEAMIAKMITAIINVNSKRKAKPKQFMPRYGGKRKQTPEQMLASLDMMYRRMS